MSLSQRRERSIGRLRASKTRRREQAVLVEGVRAATEALDAGVEVSFAVTSPRLEASVAGLALRERLAAHDMSHVDDATLERLSDTRHPQGVLLVCREPEARLLRLPEGMRCLVLDAVQDPGNAGTLVRAAVAFGMDAVVVLDGTVDPWSPKTVRASAGMIFRIAVVQATVEELVARLRAIDVPIYVADARGEETSEGIGGAFALAVGNEGGGVRQELRQAAARQVAVRMAGPAESLNVAMAGAILLHALTR